MKRKMKIDLHDLYQFLITECRYGYTRNNHLMPSGAYTHVRKYLPLMKEQDLSFAESTAKQLCEECIQNQMTTFMDIKYLDDNNRQESLFFIQYLIDFIKEATSEDWKPYNYDLYLENKVLDDKKAFHLYKCDYDSIISQDKIVIEKQLTSSVISKSEAVNYIFELIFPLYESDATYRHFDLDGYKLYIFDNMKLVYGIKEDK